MRVRQWLELARKGHRVGDTKPRRPAMSTVLRIRIALIAALALILAALAAPLAGPHSVEAVSLPAPFEHGG